MKGALRLEELGQAAVEYAFVAGIVATLVCSLYGLWRVESGRSPAQSRTDLSLKSAPYNVSTSKGVNSEWVGDLLQH